MSLELAQHTKLGHKGVIEVQLMFRFSDYSAFPAVPQFYSLEESSVCMLLLSETKEVKNMDFLENVLNPIWSPKRRLFIFI